MSDLKSFDYLPGTDIHLYQRKDMFKMNTDTALLGHFMVVQENETILDIGTNNGALLLYANLHHPSHMIGVDIQEEACVLAKENMEYHHIMNADILCGDIQDITMEPVDVIVCNPPYFKVQESSHVNVSKALQYARHEVYLNLDSLFQSVRRLRKDNGRLYLVHRSERITDILCGLREISMEAKRIQFIYDENKETARSVLIEAVGQGKSHCIVMAPQIITR